MAERNPFKKDTEDIQFNKANLSRQGTAFIHERKTIFTRQKYFYFNLVGANGEIIATSEMYTEKHNIVEVLGMYFPNFKIIGD